MYRIAFLQIGAYLTTGCTNDVVGHGAYGRADEWQQDGGEDVVPTSAGHFASVEEDGGQQKSECDPGNVEDGGCDASLHRLHEDIVEAEALEFAGELIDFAEGVDGPAVTEFAEDGFLRASQFAGTAKAVSDYDAAARTQKAVRLIKECGFVCALSVATALDREDGIEGRGGVCCVLVVAEGQGNLLAFRAGAVESTALLKLPGDEGDPVQVGFGEAAGEAAQGGTEAASHV